MYRMFYNHEVTGDTLFIIMNSSKIFDHGVTIDDVYAMYSGDELIGVNINNLSRILKIKAHGMIVTPGEELVNVVNSILKRAKIAPLPYCTYSGYRVGQIEAIEGNKITVEMAGEHLKAISNYSNLKVGDYAVLALDGTIQYNGATFRNYIEDGTTINCLICNAKELRLNIEGEGAFVVEGYKTGEDFYLGGE